MNLTTDFQNTCNKMDKVERKNRQIHNISMKIIKCIWEDKNNPLTAKKVFFFKKGIK